MRTFEEIIKEVYRQFGTIQSSGAIMSAIYLGRDERYIVLSHPDARKYVFQSLDSHEPHKMMGVPMYMVNAESHIHVGSVDQDGEYSWMPRHSMVEGSAEVIRSVPRIIPSCAMDIAD